MLHTHGVAGSSPVVPTIRGINSVVECHLAKVKVASPNLVSRSKRILADDSSIHRLEYYGTIAKW